jgi:hypothetical protein
MFEFNWGVFWAILAAFAVRAIIRVVWTIWRVEHGFRSLDELPRSISAERGN